MNVLYIGDTDSIKVENKKFDKKVIDDYNKKVEEKIRKASDDLEIPIERFKPKDVKGKERMLGIFDHDADYKEFITQGAKKYAYIDKKYGEIHITCSGVPKKGAKALKSLSEFKDNFVFDYKYTDKNLCVYNENMEKFTLLDYKGKSKEVTDKYGVILIPTTYELGKSEEYSNLISDESSKRAIFKE